MADRNSATWSRRALLSLSASTTLALGLLGAVAQAQEAAVCVNLDTLPASQKSMRRSLNFKLVSSDPKTRCGGCAFYSGPVIANACGKCQLLSGGAVGVDNVCDNWSAKR